MFELYNKILSIRRRTIIIGCMCDGFSIQDNGRVCGYVAFASSVDR